MSNSGQGREAAFFGISARPNPALADVGPALGHVRRLPQTLIVPALLAATAAAFAVTERLKLEKSPITGTRVDKVFSPVCECARDIAEISFRLRGGQVVTVDMLDSNGRPGSHARSQQAGAGGACDLRLGRAQRRGRVVTEGIYRPRVRLRRHGRTIVLPNPIRGHERAEDHAHPRLPARVLAGWRRQRGPRHRGVRDRRAARAMMLVNGRRRAPSKSERPRGGSSGSGASAASRSGRATTRSDSARSTVRATARSGHGRSRCVRYVELVLDRVEAVAEGGSPSASRLTRTCTAGLRRPARAARSRTAARSRRAGDVRALRQSGAGPIGPKSPSPSRPSPGAGSGRRSGPGRGSRSRGRSARGSTCARS